MSAGQNIAPLHAESNHQTIQAAPVLASSRNRYLRHSRRDSEAWRSAARVVVPDPTPSPSEIREALRSYEDISADAVGIPGVGSWRARSRWIAAVVLLVVVVLFGATLGRRYMNRMAKPTPASEAAPSPSVSGAPQPSSAAGLTIV